MGTVIGLRVFGITGSVQIQGTLAAWESLGLPYIRVHGLRHTFATQALRARVPFHVVSRILGHSSVTVTLETYAHLVSGDNLRAMTEIADSILGEPPTDEI